jgi:hypothetical protein
MLKGDIKKLDWKLVTNIIIIVLIFVITIVTLFDKVEINFIKY